MNYDNIEYLVTKIKTNDNTSKEKLLKEFRPFILNLSNRTHIYGYTNEDIQNECYRILFRCVKLYNPEKHRFVAYATNGIKNSINDLIRKSKTHELTDGQSALIIDKIDDNLFKDNIDVFNESCKKLDNTILYNTLNKLSEEERSLIFHIYFKESTLREFSNLKHIPYYKVLQMKSNILEKLFIDLFNYKDTLNFAE